MKKNPGQGAKDRDRSRGKILDKELKDRDRKKKKSWTKR